MDTENTPKTDKPWLWKKGQSGNPGGRPKGKGLKEYDREKFAAMSDEDKEAFLEKIPPELRYRMAEGNPHQTSDSKVDGVLVVEIAKEIAEKHDVPTSNTEPSSEG